MGAGCCSNDKDGSRALAAVKDNDAVPGAPAADDVCPDDDTCCQDDDCADDFDSLLSLDLRCCTTNEEACDGIYYFPASSSPLPFFFVPSLC